MCEVICGWNWPSVWRKHFTWNLKHLINLPPGLLFLVQIRVISAAAIVPGVLKQRVFLSLSLVFGFSFQAVVFTVKFMLLDSKRKCQRHQALELIFFFFFNSSCSQRQSIQNARCISSGQNTECPLKTTGKRYFQLQKELKIIWLIPVCCKCYCKKKTEWYRRIN